MTMKMFQKFKVILLLPIFYSASVFAGKESGPIQFIQLGLIHNAHFDSAYHYPPSMFLDIVEKVKPDLICGEAEEESWNKGLAGVYPFENRILEFAGKKLGLSSSLLTGELPLQRQKMFWPRSKNI